MDNLDHHNHNHNHTQWMMRDCRQMMTSWSSRGALVSALRWTPTMNVNTCTATTVSTLITLTTSLAFTLTRSSPWRRLLLLLLLLRRLRARLLLRSTTPTFSPLNHTHIYTYITLFQYYLAMYLKRTQEETNK